MRQLTHRLSLEPALRLFNRLTPHYLSQVRVGKGLLGCDSPIWVNLKHCLKKIDCHRVGAAKHLIELFLLHPGKRVDVILGLNTRDLVHGLLGGCPAEGQNPCQLIDVLKIQE